MRLQSRQIVGREPGPHLLITGGVHGDEFEPMAAVRRLLRQIAPAGLRGRLMLVPVVNEPAFLLGRRTADDGLDLARTCPGRPDGTVTERIAHALSELIRAADYYIDLHAGGMDMCVLPLVGYMLHPNPAVLERQRKMARAFNLPIIWGTDPGLEGRSLSVARDADIPAIYAEYHGSGTCAPAGVETYVEGCRNVMACLGMIDHAAPPPVLEHVVEDDRPNAGHLQICNPSPLTGFFEPAVTLGERVRAGDPIGTVSDALGDVVKTVRARQDGLVLVLRTFARVREGDSVAVILETDSAARGATS